MADRRERQVGGHQRAAGRRQLSQKIHPDSSRLGGIVLKTVLPLGIIESDSEHRVPGERQLITARLQPDDAVPGSVAAGAADEHSRRHLVLGLERPQLAAVLVQELGGGPPQARPVSAAA